MVKGGGFHPAVGEEVLRKLREEEKLAGEGLEGYFEIPGTVLGAPAAIYTAQGFLIDRYRKGGSAAKLTSHSLGHVGWKKFAGFNRAELVRWQLGLLGTNAASTVSPNDEYYEQDSYAGTKAEAAVRDAAKRMFAGAQGARQQLQEGHTQESQGGGASVDSSAARNEMMSDNVSRHELDAKLELLNQKAEANIAKLSMEMQAFLKQQSERDKRIDERYAEFSARLADRDAMISTVLMQSNKRLEDHEKVVASNLDGLKSEFMLVKNSVGAFDGKMTAASKSFRNTAFTVVLAFLAIAATIVLGIWGANSTIVGSAQSLISGGRDIQKQEQQISEALVRNQQQVNDMQKTLEVKIEASDATMREVLQFITRPKQPTPAPQSEQTP